MRVSVIINRSAGSVNEALIQDKVSRALFRCELSFCTPLDKGELYQFILSELSHATNYIMICGGDGTINVAVSVLMKLKNEGFSIPPICLVRSGTANDLAHEMGVSEKIERAARNILEGKIKIIDVIEVEAANEKAYMLTNGGLGVPAVTAEKANLIRKQLSKKSQDQNNLLLAKLSSVGQKLVKQMGSSIYGTLLAESLLSWDKESWNLEIDIPEKGSFQTKAPFILINNQPTTGKSFKTAPLTKNDDGTFNILVVPYLDFISQATAIGAVATGRLLNGDECPSYEATTIHIRRGEHSRALSFFGDGEILFKDVDALSLRCLHPGLPIVVRS